MVDVVEDHRPLLGGDPAGEAPADRDADALLDLLLDAERRARDELVRLLVEQEDRARVYLEDLAGAVEQGSEQLVEAQMRQRGVRDRLQPPDALRVEPSGHTAGGIPAQRGAKRSTPLEERRRSTAAASARPAATSASHTARKRIGSTEARRASGSRQSAAAVTSAPAIARRVRHCWPNQPKSGPVKTAPRSTRCSLTKNPRAFASV